MYSIGGKRRTGRGGLGSGRMVGECAADDEGDGKRLERNVRRGDERMARYLCLE